MTWVYTTLKNIKKTYSNNSISSIFIRLSLSTGVSVCSGSSSELDSSEPDSDDESLELEITTGDGLLTHDLSSALSRGFSVVSGEFLGRFGSTLNRTS